MVEDFIFPYIAHSEWQCHHCGKYPLRASWTLALFMKFYAIRKEFNKPIIITSGWRCMEHQKELKEKGYKTALISPHLFGSALDLISDNNQELYNIIERLHPELRIGISKYDGKLIHIDNAYEIPLNFIDLFTKHFGISGEYLELIKRSWVEGVRW